LLTLYTCIQKQYQPLIMGAIKLQKAGAVVKNIPCKHFQVIIVPLLHDHHCGSEEFLLPNKKNQRNVVPIWHQLHSSYMSSSY